MTLLDAYTLRFLLRTFQGEQERYNTPEKMIEFIKTAQELAEPIIGTPAAIEKYLEKVLAP
jgi:hypothetical protein